MRRTPGHVLVALTGALLAAGAGAWAGVATASAAPMRSSVHAARPAAEHVSPKVHTVVLRHTSSTVITPTSNSGSGSHAVVHGKKAKRLVTLFNHLKRAPADMVHCDLAGGPETTVTFRGHKHTWVARDAGCATGGLAVTRDGKVLPTLTPSAKWTNTVNRYLGL